MLSRRIQRTASSDAKNPHCKEMSERRRVLEQARTMNVRRIQQEVQRIAQREVEYAQRLISEYAPIKLSVNESAWARWQDFIPIRLEFVNDPSTSTSTPTQSQEETQMSSDTPIA